MNEKKVRVIKARNKNETAEKEVIEKRVVVYCRVSTVTDTYLQHDNSGYSI